jgi:hypothetical protein
MGNKPKPQPTNEPLAPVATIYQNSDQIAGILQQIVRQPLIVDETREISGGGGTDATVEATGGADSSGALKVPLFGKIGLGIHAEAGLNASWTETTGTASRQQFVYSQAYYLHLVRGYLRDQQQLTQLGSVADAAGLKPGVFVEYSTAFDPAELALALEVITPALVEQIARYQVKRAYIEDFPTTGGHDAVVLHAEKMNAEADAKGELSFAIAQAVKADARQETTREYYGRIAADPALTAITICDLAHFIVADPDRLLDGTFTVLGKVISVLEVDVPTFARNKLLRNLSAEALDSGIEQLQASMERAPKLGGKSPSAYVDLKFDSRVRGASIRVLPLAIYT